MFERVFDTSTATYSLVFATNAAAMLAANSLSGRLSVRVRLNTLLSAGIGIALAGTALQVLLLATVGATMAGTWVSLAIALAGIGMSFPTSMTISMTLGRETAGTAAALQGAATFTFGAVCAPLVGVFGGESATPMAVIMLAALGCSAVALVGLARPWHGRGEPRAS